jgi:hypothetical protein
VIRKKEIKRGINLEDKKFKFLQNILNRKKFNREFYSIMFCGSKNGNIFKKNYLLQNRESYHINVPSKNKTI